MENQRALPLLHLILNLHWDARVWQSADCHTRERSDERSEKHAHWVSYPASSLSSESGSARAQSW